MILLFVSIAPVAIILFYIYFRDKYEHEPIGLLLKALASGAFIVLPVILIEILLTSLGTAIWDPASNLFWEAFVVAGFTEEFFKFLALLLLIWVNRNFNEKFDGIVYAVFISLGFALIENILYVTKGGLEVGWIRAVTAVPAHALFGVVMGYYTGLARFSAGKKNYFLTRALLAPILLHGLYDFILITGIPILLALFIPYITYLWLGGFKKMKELSEASQFKPQE